MSTPAKYKKCLGCQVRMDEKTGDREESPIQVTAPIPNGDEVYAPCCVACANDRPKYDLALDKATRRLRRNPYTFSDPGTRVMAFHPKTFGVIHPGQIVKSELGMVRVDFSPLTFRGKSAFWVPATMVYSLMEWDAMGKRLRAERDGKARKVGKIAETA